MSTLVPSALPPSAFMAQLAMGHMLAQCVAAAARLGVADHLASGPKTATELATVTGTQPVPLYRLLRALSDAGVFAESDGQRFALTPLGDTLRSGVPHSVRAFAAMMGDSQYRAWADLGKTLRTGQPAFDHVHGMPVFDYFERHPDEFRVFDQAMQDFYGPENRAIASSCDFPYSGVVADLGGGKGGLLSAVLQAHPGLRGILFDMPQVIQRSREALPSDRIEFRAGDFFQAVPAGADVYMMRHILHDWNDEQSRTILRNIRAVIPPHGRLLVAESVVTPPGVPSPSKMLDVHMMVVTGGLERTEQEYRDLFASAGFQLTRVVPTPAPVEVVEAVPA